MRMEKILRRRQSNDSENDSENDSAHLPSRFAAL